MTDIGIAETTEISTGFPPHKKRPSDQSETKKLLIQENPYLQRTKKDAPPAYFGEQDPVSDIELEMKRLQVTSQLFKKWKEANPNKRAEFGQAVGGMFIQGMDRLALPPFTQRLTPEQRKYISGLTQYTNPLFGTSEFEREMSKVGFLGEYAVLKALKDGSSTDGKNLRIRLPTSEEDRFAKVDAFLEMPGKDVALQIKAYGLDEIPDDRYIHTISTNEQAGALTTTLRDSLKNKDRFNPGKFERQAQELLKMQQHGYETAYIIIPTPDDKFGVYNQISGIPRPDFSKELYNQVRDSLLT